MALTKEVVWEGVYIRFKDQTNGNKNNWTEVEHMVVKRVTDEVKRVTDEDDGIAKIRDDGIIYTRDNITDLQGKIPNYIYNDLISH